MRECRTALRLAVALTSGEPLAGLLLGGAQPQDCFKGRIDAQCAAIAGHSYGGLTCGVLAAEEPAFSCAVSIDPWWCMACESEGKFKSRATNSQRRGGLPEDAAACKAWATDTPMLILGSHAWNQPNKGGKIMSEGQASVMEAAARRAGSSKAGPGAVLFVIEGTSHDTCIDVRTIFGSKYGWVVKPLMGKHTMVPGAKELTAQDGIDLTASCMAHFLRHHLMLTGAQHRWLASCDIKPTDGATEPDQQQQQKSGDSGQDSNPEVADSGNLDRADPSRQLSERTRAHTVGSQDLEAFRRIAQGRIFKSELSGGSVAAVQATSMAECSILDNSGTIEIA